MRAFSFLAAMTVSCGIDVSIVGAIFGTEHDAPGATQVAPEPVMQGTATGLSGARVQLIDAAAVSQLDATTASNGAFTFTLKSQTAYRNYRTVVTKGELVLLAFAPNVSATTPGQGSAARPRGELPPEGMPGGVTLPRPPTA